MRATTKLSAVLAAAGAALCAAAASSAAGAPGEPLRGLTQLSGGRWDLRVHDRSVPAEQICLRDGRQLIQLRHRQQECERFVVADAPHEVTVQYTCRGKGYGRTHIRLESERLVQIETQGIADGLPFNFTAEGRWVSTACPG